MILTSRALVFGGLITLELCAAMDEVRSIEQDGAPSTTLRPDFSSPPPVTQSTAHRQGHKFVSDHDASGRYIPDERCPRGYVPVSMKCRRARHKTLYSMQCKMPADASVGRVVNDMDMRAAIAFVALRLEHIRFEKVTTVHVHGRCSSGYLCDSIGAPRDGRGLWDRRSTHLVGQQPWIKCVLGRPRGREVRLGQLELARLETEASRHQQLECSDQSASTSGAQQHRPSSPLKLVIPEAHLVIASQASDLTTPHTTQNSLRADAMSLQQAEPSTPVTTTSLVGQARASDSPTASSSLEHLPLTVEMLAEWGDVLEDEPKDSMIDCSSGRGDVWR